MKCTIREMRVLSNKDGRAPFVTLATAEIEWPEFGLLVRGARLTLTEGGGFVALPPLAKNKIGGLTPVSWRSGTALENSAREAMLGMYGKMSGGDEQ